MIKGRYQAAFIIPVGANKVLSEDGWEFESSGRLSEEIRNDLIQVLGLNFLESYLGIDVYSNDDIKMSIINDDLGLTESISLQLYGNDSLVIISKAFESERMSSAAELFVPTSPPQST